MNRSILLLAALAIGANSFAEDDSQDCACRRCGCQSHCRKVCRVVCEMKDVKEVCYDCKCEDFCVPGPSCKCGEVCECDPCHHGSDCKCFDCLLGGHGGKSCRTVWKPSCEARIHSRNKLIKYEITKKVPTYKWVVEYCCDRCQCATPCPAAESNTPPAELDLPNTAEHGDTYAAKPVLPWTRLFK